MKSSLIQLLLDQHRFDVYSRFLNEHKVAFGYSHEWIDADGSEKTASGGPYATADEAHKAKINALDAMGWAAPKWWQYWRWGEAKIYPPV